MIECPTDPIILKKKVFKSFPVISCLLYYCFPDLYQNFSNYIIPTSTIPGDSLFYDLSSIKPRSDVSEWDSSLGPFSLPLGRIQNIRQKKSFWTSIINLGLPRKAQNHAVTGLDHTEEAIIKQCWKPPEVVCIKTELWRKKKERKSTLTVTTTLHPQTWQKNPAPIQMQSLACDMGTLSASPCSSFNRILY